MGYVVTLQGYRPSPRHDDIPWTEARIEESASSSGPWALIETVALVPDADPSRPSYRDFTTEDATLQAGWYRVIFADATGDVDQPTDPVFTGQAVTYRPSVSDVAQHLLTRTYDDNGQRLGTFTADTTPTDLEVERIISSSVRDVAQIIGVVVPTEVSDMVRDLVSLRAAIRVERTYFPEQLSTDRSLYEALKEEYDAMVTTVLEASREVAHGGEIGGTDEPLTALGNFPEDVGGMIGWGTRW